MIDGCWCSEVSPMVSSGTPARAAICLMAGPEDMIADVVGQTRTLFRLLNDPGTES